jgi:hypothetical protein
VLIICAWHVLILARSLPFPKVFREAIGILILILVEYQAKTGFQKSRALDKYLLAIMDNVCLKLRQAYSLCTPWGFDQTDSHALVLCDANCCYLRLIAALDNFYKGSSKLP